ncbi:MAG: hypothetical protein Q8M02_01270 [Candidatus Didemnitutus sp.]|nr:hypothetical protein [Candidatus Didemnitutus sp.]
MFLLERHAEIPLHELGAFIQRCVDSGATIVVVTRNPDGKTFAVSVERG